MPKGAKLVLFGALSESPCAAIDPIGVIFRDKSISGFYLRDWLAARGLPGILRATSRVQRLVAGGAFETTILRRVGLDEAIDGLLAYRERMTAGKVLLRPHSTNSA